MLDHLFVYYLISTFTVEKAKQKVFTINKQDVLKYCPLGNRKVTTLYLVMYIHHFITCGVQEIYHQTNVYVVTSQKLLRFLRRLQTK